MNIPQKIAASLLLNIFLCIPLSAEVVDIPDPNLARSVRETLNLPNGVPITQADMSQLTKLKSPSKQIQNLNGLDHAVNITWIDFEDNQITDLSPIAALTQLEVLRLGKNQITDLSPIAELTQLSTFYAWECEIADISPLANLTRLTHLDLSYNRIVDISPLANLTRLTELVIRGNEIANSTPLANLINLKELWIQRNNIVDVDPLANLTRLTKLRLHNNEIADITPLATLTNLVRLELQDNRITDVTPLENLKNLEHLNTQNNPIFDPNSPLVNIPDHNFRAVVRETLNLPDGVPVTRAAMLRLTRIVGSSREIANLTGLSFAKNLEFLELCHSPISDLSPLTNLTQLHSLFVWDCDVVDISPLVNLTRLAYLDLSYNRISNITPLANLTELIELLLIDNLVTDVRPLANLANLALLWIERNNIVDISPLANLIRLTKLRLHNNEIADIAPLASLTNLVRLELQDNRITDITPLENLKKLEYLNTQNNPLFDPDSPLVDIPDPNLRAVVRETLNLPDGTPTTRAAMLRLTRIVGSSRDIANLTGLEFAENLELLELCHSPIADLTPLASLTRLHSLFVWDCDVVDISPLANLTHLAYLDLSYNHISDISPLANLTELIELLLIDNLITDVNPLADLTNLEKLWLQQNDILDYSPLDALSIGDFRYDQVCDIPPQPLRPRLENRSFPSLFAAWGGPGWIRTLNRPDLSDIENLASHDLWFSNPRFGLDFRDTSQGIKVAGMLAKAIQRRDEFLAYNPNMIFLVQLPFRAALLDEYPADWPYWLRDAHGEIVRAGGELLSPPVHDAFINFTHPGFQDRMVAQAVTVSECGLYDGIMIDWWNDYAPLLVTHDPHKEHVGYETEMQAKINILERIRAETRPDFLIMANVNQDKLPRTGQYINGGFMETIVPSARHPDDIERGLRMTENSLLWLEENLREPQINALEGWSVPTEPADSPTNLRWMRAFTTMSLTHSDGYVLFQTGGGHKHYWYDFWGADLGRPLSDEKAQFYDNREGLYIREFTNGWAVYNHSGETQEITLPELVTGAASGVEGTTHTLPNLDGEMYLRAKPVSPADVNGDGVVNIFDLTLVAQAFGKDGLEADVNGDGVVNVFDLVFVAGEMQ